jgi:Ser/Thr protein kinase RdoA (MazF antagonist)
MATVNGIDLPGISVTESTFLDAVLSNYPPPLRAAAWTSLGSAGGFSGSRIWRGALRDGHSFALKAFPIGFDLRRLEQVHKWMTAARDARLDFVPCVERCANGRTITQGDGRCWEITSWMPGSADFHNNPCDAKLSAAVAAAARIHEAWKAETRHARCPAVLRRWQSLCEWEELVRSGWRPRFESLDPIAPHAEVAWNCMPAAVAIARQLLIPWLDRVVPLQPSIGDVWHDHILFQGDEVSGIIDYAAAKLDHVAADLARLLGSLVEGEATRVGMAIQTYRAVRQLPDVELIPILDHSGVVASIANWLRRLYFEYERIPDRAAVASRISKMVRRLL